MGQVIIDGSVSGSITNLDSLSQITSVGGGLHVYDNAALTSLSGLDNLTSVGGYVYVGNNAALTSLSGLDNIDPATITEMVIAYNPQLFLCDVQSVCKYLQSGGPVSISDNAPGCNSVPEIKAACLVPTGEAFSGDSPLFVFPNPANDLLQIRVKDHDPWELSLFDLRGRLLYRQLVSRSQTIGVETWPSGLYTLRAVSGERVFVGKIVKQ